MFKKLLLVVLPVVAITLFTSEQMSDNGKAGKTGSPGELDCTDCHNDFGVNTGGGSISITATGMPTSEYTPGQTYNMSVTVARSANGLFGVGIEALTASQANGGTLNITDATHTQIKSATVNAVSRRNVVHTLNGGAATASKTFNFSWTAPAAGTGPVTFYFAGVAANADGNETGDYVYKSSQVFNEATCATPAQPGAISGGASPCSGASVTYSVAAVSGATAYTWTLPSGWTGSSTGSSINVTAGSGAGTISVTADNSCGSSTAQTLAVSAGATPAQPGTISGGASPCSGAAVIYSVGAVSGATSYTWTLPSGWTGSSTGNSINVTAGSASGNVTVTANNSCGSSTARTLAVTAAAAPAQPGAISGGASPCSGAAETYSVGAVSGATSYTWTLPSGWTGSSTSNSINVTAGSASGTISVTASNACGTSTAQTLAVTTGAAPAQPGSISGLTSLCSGTSTTYSVAAVAGATSYTWTLPSGWSGTSTTNSITATSGGTSGDVSVTANNGCGSSPARNLAVTAGSISIASATNATTCHGGSDGSANVTVTGGSGPYTYLWSNGNTTASVSGLPAGNYSVAVTDQTGCVSNSSVTITEPDAITADPGANALICSGASATLGGSPTATGGTGALSYQWSPATGLSSTTDPNPVATPASAITYSVVVTDANNCSVSASVQVDIDATPAPVITMSGDTLYTSGGTTYEWYLNGNLVGSGATPYFVPTQSGNYEVVAYSAAGCPGVSPVFAFSPVGIFNNASLQQLRMFPNPARDEFRVQLPAGASHAVVALLDVTGKEVMRTEIDGNQAAVAVDKLQRGIYLISLVTGDERLFGRLILE